MEQYELHSEHDPHRFFHVHLRFHSFCKPAHQLLHPKIQPNVVLLQKKKIVYIVAIKNSMIKSLNHTCCGKNRCPCDQDCPKQQQHHLCGKYFRRETIYCQIFNRKTLRSSITHSLVFLVAIDPRNPRTTGWRKPWALEIIFNAVPNGVRPVYERGAKLQFKRKLWDIA